MTVDEIIKELEKDAKEKSAQISSIELEDIKKRVSRLYELLKDDLRNQELPTAIIELSFNPIGCLTELGLNETQSTKLHEVFGAEEDVIRKIMWKHIDRLNDELMDYLKQCFINQLIK